MEGNSLALGTAATAFSPFTNTVVTTVQTGLVFEGAVASLAGYTDENGVNHVLPNTDLGRWNKTGTATSMALTLSFSPAVPANRIGFFINDLGVPTGTQAYAPVLTFTPSGGATSADFAMRNYPGFAALPLNYNSATGVVTRSNGIRSPGQHGSLVGTSTALVSQIVFTATGILAADGVVFVLYSIPSCVKVAKTTVGGTGSFNYSYTNLSASNAGAVTTDSVTTTIANTPANGTQRYATALGTAVTIDETVTSGYLLNSATCVDANASLSGNPATVGSLTGSTVTLPAGTLRPEANITCTFTNTKQPILRLSKSLPNGRVAPGDQFALNIAGTNGPASATTTGATNTPTEAATLNNAAVGASYTLSEVAAGTTTLTNYASSISCSNGGTGGNTTTLPSGTGTSFNLTPAAGDNISCVYSNAAQVADLSISKTANPTSVVSGGLVTYTLTVNNAGPVAANNSVLRDAPGTDLDCTQGGLAAPTCSASGGAACPAGLTNAGLTGSGGVAIPTLPAGGGVVVTMQCRATASGIP